MPRTGFGLSDVGRKRKNNEDAFHIDDQLGLYVVCDGMGGHQGGEIASKAAIEAVVDSIGSNRDELSRLGDGEQARSRLSKIVEDAVHIAGSKIYDHASSRPELKGMGCTLTLLLIRDEIAAIGHVGDTRLYIYREGKAHQLSSDHTLTNELVRSGVITQEDAADHPQKNILTRAVGTQASVSVDARVIEVLPNDRFLLCSDGLNEYIDDISEIERALAHPNPSEIPSLLVQHANEAGGRDNVTAVVIEQ